MTKTSRDKPIMAWHGASESTCEIYPGFFHSMEEDDLFDLKHEQENAVHCLSEPTDDFAAMSTEYSKRLTFQLFATAEMIKKFRNGQHSDTVLLVTRITTIIQVQVKEGTWLRLRSAKHNVAVGKTQDLHHYDVC